MELFPFVLIASILQKSSDRFNWIITPKDFFIFTNSIYLIEYDGELLLIA